MLQQVAAIVKRMAVNIPFHRARCAPATPVAVATVAVTVPAKCQFQPRQ